MLNTSHPIRSEHKTENIGESLIESHKTKSEPHLINDKDDVFKNVNDNKDSKDSRDNKTDVKQDIKIENKNQIYNSINVNNDSGSILVKHDQKEASYSFFNRNRTLLGTFRVLHLLKYIISDFPDFLGVADIGGSVDVIKTYICIVEKQNNTTNIRLLNQLESPFMGNIEMLIKLYNGISQYHSFMDKELQKYIPKDRNYIEFTIKQFVHQLLNHILKIIANISEAIKDDNDKRSMKDRLLKYTVAIVYKISGMIKDDLDKKTTEYKSLQEDLVRLSSVKVNMYSKLTELQTLVTAQNAKIDNMVSLSTQTPQKGGDNSTTITSSRNRTSDRTSRTSDTSTIVSKDNREKKYTSDTESTTIESNDLSDVSLSEIGRTTNSTTSSVSNTGSTTGNTSHHTNYYYTEPISEQTESSIEYLTTDNI